MRAPLVIAGICVPGLAGGGAWYGLKVWPAQQFRAGLDRTLATLPAGTTATYKTADYSLPTKHAVVTGLTLHGLMPGTTPLPFDLTIESLETDNANPDAGAIWADAAARGAAPDKDVALPVADTIVMRGVTLHSAMGNMTGQSFRISKLRLYPWALRHAGMPSWDEIQAAVMPGTEPKQIADLKPFLRAEAAVLLGVAHDGYTADSTTVTQSSPAAKVSYTIRTMTGGAFDRGVMHGGTAEGIAGEAGPAGTFAIDRLEMGTLDVRAAMTRIMNDEPPSPALLDGIRLDRVVYTGITVQPPGQQAVHVGGVSLGPLEFARGLPVKCQLGWTDVTVARDQMPEAEAREAFDQLGLQTITLSFALAYDWDVDHQRLALRDTVLKVNELGTITLSAELTGVTADAAALAQAKLVHARLRLDDASLVDRLLRMGATKSGEDPVAFRQEIVSQARQQGSDTGNPAFSAASQAAGDFIASPHALVIELSPKSPVPFVAFLGAMSDPAKTAAMLGLVVSANQ